MASQLNQKVEFTVCRFAERMALYTYTNSGCLKQMQRYTAEHSDVISIIKEILEEKHELSFILGLRAHQRKDAIQLMAVYICAARNQDWDFFNQIIDLVNKTSPKGSIDISAILALCENIIRSKNSFLAYKAALEKRLNVFSRAFYPAVIVCKSNILNTEHADLILDSALCFYVGRQMTLGQDGNEDSALYRYLRITVSDKVLAGTLADVFPFGQIAQGAPNMSFDDIGSYSYRSITLNALVALCSSRSGLLQEHVLQSITFNKEKRVKLTALTAIICQFSLKQESLETIAQKYLDGEQDTCSASERKMMERFVDEFTISLRNVTYLSSCLELYRKSVLAMLDNEFFNPDLRQATKWAQQLERTVERQKAEIANEKATMKTLRSQNRELTTEIAETRNKYAGLQSKIAQQQERISQLESQLEELQRKNVDLQQDIADLLPQSSDSGVDSIPDDSDTTATDYRAILAPVFAAHKIVFIGGYETSVMAKFSQRNPAATVVPLSRIAVSESLIENADAILFKTDHLSHSDYFKVKSIAYKKRIPFDYLNSGTNVQRLEENTAEILSAMGFLE